MNEGGGGGWGEVISYPDLTLFYTVFPLTVGDLGTRLGERRKRLPANPTIFKNCLRPRTQLLIVAVLGVFIK